MKVISSQAACEDTRRAPGLGWVRDRCGVRVAVVTGAALGRDIRLAAALVFLQWRDAKLHPSVSGLSPGRAKCEVSRASHRPCRRDRQAGGRSWHHPKQAQGNFLQALYRKLLVLQVNPDAVPAKPARNRVRGAASGEWIEDRAWNDWSLVLACGSPADGLAFWCLNHSSAGSRSPEHVLPTPITRLVRG